jgi:hypothetical protein
MPVEELFNPCKDIGKLDQSQRAFKGTVTQHKSKAMGLFTIYKRGDDPTHLELILKKWECAITKYAQAEEDVMSDPMAVKRDSDALDLGDQEGQFLTFQTKVIGFRRDFDKSQEPFNPINYPWIRRWPKPKWPWFAKPLRQSALNTS